jgi:fatty acid desaturase
MTKKGRSPRLALIPGIRERIRLPNPAVSGCTNYAVLRKRADLGPVVFVLMIASIQAFLFLQSSVLVAALGAAVLWPIQTRTIYIAHNHHHHPVFRRRSLKLIFETLLFLQTGMPSFGFPLHHNRGHHVSYRNQDPGHSDADPHCWIGADGQQLGRWSYTWRLLRIAVPTARRLGLQHPQMWRNFLYVSAFYGVALALLLAVKPLHTLSVFLLPMALSLVALSWSTYVHHLGLLTDDPYGASYTNVDSWANRWGYNIGYHTAHHLQPGLHWSELPALHARIADRIPEHCYYDGKVAAHAILHARRS